MELVVFSGIQASGKSSFYKERLFHSHVRISLDQLRTRHRERRLLETCLELHQPAVIDNTNPSIEERARYIAAAREAGIPVRGFYFCAGIKEALARNAEREGKARIPDKGVLGTYGRLQIPSPAEGFDELFFVRLQGNGFCVEAFEESKA